MPGETMRDWESAPPGEPVGRLRALLVRQVDLWVVAALSPALAASAAVLLVAQLFSAYRTVWPADVAQANFVPYVGPLSIRVGYLISAPSTFPVLVAALPLVVLAVLAHVRPGGAVLVVPVVRRAGTLIASATALVGMLLLFGMAVGTLITRGVIGDPLRPDVPYVTFDPVVTFLVRGGDGLATAALAGTACWLLLRPPTTPPQASGDVAQGGVAAVVAPPSTSQSSDPALASPPGTAPAPTLAQAPAPVSGEHALTAAPPPPPRPTVDPAIFRRPSDTAYAIVGRPLAATGSGAPETAGQPAESSAAPDPALLFRRPSR